MKFVAYCAIIHKHNMLHHHYHIGQVEIGKEIREIESNKHNKRHNWSESRVTLIDCTRPVSVSILKCNLKSIKVTAKQQICVSGVVVIG